MWALVRPRVVARGAQHRGQEPHGGTLALGARDVNHLIAEMGIRQSVQQAMHAAHVEALGTLGGARSFWNPGALVVLEGRQESVDVEGGGWCDGAHHRRATGGGAAIFLRR